MKHRSFIIFLALAAAGLVCSGSSCAQQVALAPYNLVRTPTPPALSKTRCTYFVRNDITGQVRSDFYYYVMPGMNSGATDEMNPTLQQILVVPGSNDIPTARKIDDPDRPALRWEITMSQATYQQNQACLPPMGTRVAVSAN
jgi:hypothetical protein